MKSRMTGFLMYDIVYSQYLTLDFLFFFCGSYLAFWLRRSQRTPGTTTDFLVHFNIGKVV